MKMKYLLLLSCLLSSAFIADAQKNKKQKTHTKTIATSPINYMEIGAPLPPIKIYRRDGQYLTNETLKNDAHLIMMLFNPTCGHCEEVTINLKKNIFLFKQSNLVLVAGKQCFLSSPTSPIILGWMVILLYKLGWIVVNILKRPTNKLPYRKLIFMIKTVSW